MGAKTKRMDDKRLEELRVRVTRWRRTRAKQGPMPAELWESAVELADEHGVYSVSKAAGLDYGSLRSRLELRDATTRDEFAVVRVPASGPDEIAGAEARVEVVEADGSRLSFRLPAGSGLDVARVVAAFRREA